MPKKKKNFHIESNLQALNCFLLLKDHLFSHRKWRGGRGNRRQRLEQTGRERGGGGGRGGEKERRKKKRRKKEEKKKKKRRKRKGKKKKKKKNRGFGNQKRDKSRNKLLVFEHFSLSVLRFSQGSQQLKRRRRERERERRREKEGNVRK